MPFHNPAANPIEWACPSGYARGDNSVKSVVSRTNAGPEAPFWELLVAVYSHPHYTLIVFHLSRPCSFTLQISHSR